MTSPAPTYLRPLDAAPDFLAPKQMKLSEEERARHREYYRTHTEYFEKYRKEHRERHREVNRIYRQKNAERISSQRKQYREANLEMIREHGRQWRKDHIDEIKRRDLERKKKKPERERTCKRHYGITIDDFNRMVSLQDGKCAICRLGFLSSRNQHIDHDHKSQVVRGVLCSNCNTGLGHFKDNEDTLRAAIAYLRGIR